MTTKETFVVTLPLTGEQTHQPTLIDAPDCGFWCEERDVA